MKSSEAGITVRLFPEPLNERVNFAVYAAFTQLRRDVNGSNATGNYFTLGLNISVEAFRWSWQ